MFHIVQSQSAKHRPCEIVLTVSFYFKEDFDMNAYCCARVFLPH